MKPLPPSLRPGGIKPSNYWPGLISIMAPDLLSRPNRDVVMSDLANYCIDCQDNVCIHYHHILITSSLSSKYVMFLRRKNMGYVGPGVRLLEVNLQLLCHGL